MEMLATPSRVSPQASKFTLVLNGANTPHPSSYNGTSTGSHTGSHTGPHTGPHTGVPQEKESPEPPGYIGIDTLRQQLHRKVLRKGFQFNILVVGQSGLGKSTLINTLFRSQIAGSLPQAPSTPDHTTSHPSSTCHITNTTHIKVNGDDSGVGSSILNNDSGLSDDGVSEDSVEGDGSTTNIRTTSHIIEESGVKLKLNVTDTPGFGDSINNEKCWVPIEEYILEQYERFFEEENNIHRQKHIPDTRVHCCIYFIPPHGHDLRPLDIVCMQRLCRITNLIPVIGKADSLTLLERLSLKEKVKASFIRHSIRIYPSEDGDEDDEEKRMNDEIRALLPYAVVGADHCESPNAKALTRHTNYGLIEIENRDHCEFSHLRDLVIRTHMHELKEITSGVFYEDFRQQKLKGSGGSEP